MNLPKAEEHQISDFLKNEHADIFVRRDSSQYSPDDDCSLLNQDLVAMIRDLKSELLAE